MPVGMVQPIRHAVGLEERFRSAIWIWRHHLALKILEVPEVSRGKRGLGVDLQGLVYELLMGALHLLSWASSGLHSGGECLKKIKKTYHLLGSVPLPFSS